MWLRSVEINSTSRIRLTNESMHELVIEYESYVTYELVVSYKVPV